MPAGQHAPPGKPIVGAAVSCDVPNTNKQKGDNMTATSQEPGTFTWEFFVSKIWRRRRFINWDYCSRDGAHYTGIFPVGAAYARTDVDAIRWAKHEAERESGDVVV